MRYTEPMATIDIASLSLEERLRLLDEVWESLSRTPEAIPLTEAQQGELDRRLNELNREGPVGIPWDVVLSSLRSNRCRSCMHARTARSCPLEGSHLIKD